MMTAWVELKEFIALPSGLHSEIAMAVRSFIFPDYMSWEFAAGAVLFVAVTYASVKFFRKNRKNSEPIALLIQIHQSAGEASNDNNWRNNALCISLLRSHPSLVNKTLSNKYSDGHGYTPFLRAAWNNNYELMEFMLFIGADVRLRNTNGETPFYLAAYRISKNASADFRALHLLLHAGCYINDQNIQGNCALHVAAKAGHIELVQWLLSHGADPQIQNYSGYRPYNIAAGYESESHQKVARLLKYHR